MSTSMKLALGVGLVLLLASPLAVAPAQAGGMTWNSDDTSYFDVTLGAGATWEWWNPDGSHIRLTGGTGGAHARFFDRKVKGGGVTVDPGWINLLMDPNYGHGGEPALCTTGQVNSGTAEFDVTLEGFVEIDDVTFTFAAELVSGGPDNPIDLCVYGQGDQLAFTPPGMLAYSTKWHSPDAFVLSNGEVMVIGDFYLNSREEITHFFYTLEPPDVTAECTIGQRCQFVYDLSLPGSGGNLRQEYDGEVSKTMVGTIELAIPTVSQWGLIVLALLVATAATLVIRKRLKRTAPEAA